MTRQQYRVRMILSVPVGEIEDEAEMAEALRVMLDTVVEISRESVALPYVVVDPSTWHIESLEVDPWD